MYNLIPQGHNDKEALKKLLRRYRSDANQSKGLLHGLQKDLIQNCVGARLSPGFKNWRVVLELIKINGKPALSVTDEGTTGLKGGVYSSEQVAEMSANGELDESHGLSRFLHQNYSDHNTGPGSEGQGKGLFHLLSENYNVVFDSLRDEGKELESYVAGQKIMIRGVLHNRLAYPESGLEPDRQKNEELFKSLTGLDPLKKQGTRVIIMNIGTNDVIKSVYGSGLSGDCFVENGKYSFLDVFRNSFSTDLEDPDCLLSLKNMILETWWEVLRNHNAKIVIKEDENEEEVCYSGSLIEKIYDAVDGQNVNVYHKRNLTGSDRLYFQESPRGPKHYIKELKYIHFKNGRPGLGPGVFLQRKGMKIGEIYRKHEIRDSLRGKFYGYVVLDKSGEEAIKKDENEVHYGFTHGTGRPSTRLRKVIKDELNPFLDRFTRGGGNSNSNSRMMDNYRSITHLLSQLGSFNNFGSHSGSKISVSWVDVGLPGGNKSVNFVDEIGPTKTKINNGESRPFIGKVCLSLYSTGTNAVLEELQSKEVAVEPGSSLGVVFNPFKIPTTFQNGLIFLKVLVSCENIKKCDKTIGLWLNKPVPENPRDKLMNLNVYSPLFPNKSSTRVDIGQSIKQLGFEFSSSLSVPISTIVRVVLEHKNEQGNWVEFHKVFEENYIVAPNNVDYSISLDDQILSDEVFGFFENKERVVDKRKVRFFISIVSNERLPLLSINKGQKMASSNRISFIVGVDSAGNSPFKNVRPFDGKVWEKSKFTGNATSGYTCEINQLFHEYKTIKDLGVSENMRDEMLEDYETREIIRQAILLCLDSQDFEGPLFNEPSAEIGDGVGRKYSEVFQDQDFILEPKKVCSVTEELINLLSSKC